MVLTKTYLSTCPQALATILEPWEAETGRTQKLGLAWASELKASIEDTREVFKYLRDFKITKLNYLRSFGGQSCVPW